MSIIYRWCIYWLSSAFCSCLFHFNICLQTMSLIPPLRVTQLQMEFRRNQRRELALIVALTVFEQQQARQGCRERTVLVKPWLLRHVTLGHYDNLVQELMRESREDFKAFLRIKPPMFREIVERLNPRISKNQGCRPGLPAGLRLAITLRFLATSESYHSLAFSFRVSHTTISLLVPEVCRDIIEEYKPQVLAMPTTPEAGWR